ncbi:MAG: hypothetical protein ACLSGQ_05805 [Parabacteroides distasonis]|jgi:hypothetical protein
MIYKFKTMAFVLLTCLTLFCFTACSEDKDDAPTPEPTPEEVSANIDYAYGCASDLLEIADIQIVYTDTTGKEVSETVQKTEWTKSLSEVKVPFTANLQIIFTKKEEFTPKKESYDMASWQYINYTTSNGKYDLGQEKESEVEVEKGDIDTHLKLLNETSKHVKEIK